MRSRREFLELMAAAVMMPAAGQVERFERRAPSQRVVVLGAGLNALFKKYVDPATEEALAAGFPRQTVRALAAWDPLTPGAWLRSKGASPAAAELIALGYGTDFGSAASFLLHGLNSRGSTRSYR